MIKKLFPFVTLIFIISIALVGCGPKDVILDAYVGDGMFAPMEAIKEIYEAQNPNVTIIYTFAGSGVLEETMRTLQQGDIYMPGSTKYIDSLNDDNLLVSSYPVAYHVPEILVREGDTTISFWDDLAKDGIRLAIPNPSLASSGRAADKIFSNSPLEAQIRANITVLSSDTRSLIQLLLDNEVDAIISWHSASKTASGIATIEIPEEINAIAEIWIAVPTYTGAESEAIAFAEFIAGAEGQKAFLDNGFLVIEK